MSITASERLKRTVTLADWEWERYARCRVLGIDPDVFFPERGVGRERLKDHAYWSAIKRAKAICAECPVQAQCLAKAKRFRVSDGVWGGRFFARREGQRSELSVVRPA